MATASKNPLSGNGNENQAGHLRSASSHLQQAARSAGDALKHANAAASEAMREDYSKEIRPELGAAADEVRQAGAQARARTEQEWQQLRSRGESLFHNGQRWVQQRPYTALGIAVASGFLLSQLLRRH